MNHGLEGVNEGAASILRAVGSLLMALSGGDDAAAQRLLAEQSQRARQPEVLPPSRPAASPAYPPPFGARSASAVPPGQPPAQPVASSSSPEGDEDDVEFVLADARERAQRIIDDSMERARELIERDRSGGAVDGEAVAEVRRSVRDLVVEVRDIQQRLARIETLLREQRAEVLLAVSAPRPAAPVADPTAYAPAYVEPATPAYAPEPAPAAVYDPAPADEVILTEPPGYEPAPISAEPGPAEPAYPAYQAPPPEPVAPAYEPALPAYVPVEPPAEEMPPAASAASAMPSPAPAPPRTPFSVVPPQRREWAAEPVAEAPAPPDLPSPPPSAVPRMRFTPASMPAADPAWADPEPDPDEPVDSGTSEAPIATFLPADGSIALRVSPVSGFQGLMRVQDALARLPSVRHASVEAYSQGEARLRIELSEPTDSEEIAAGLARSLKEPAHVQQASETDRVLLIALR